MIELSRRKLIGSLATLICAPAIVKASSLMAVRPWREDAWELLIATRENPSKYIVEGRDQYGNFIFEIIEANDVFKVISRKKYEYGIVISPAPELNYG